MATELRILGPDAWQLWREVRLRALADSPDAFGSTLAREQGYDDTTWADDLAEAHTVVVLEDERLVACGAAFEKAPGRAAVIAMWTDPAHRGHGHARAVLDALVGWASGRGLSVELGVNRLNAGARELYAAYGFVPTGHCRPLRDGSDQICDVWELSRG